MSAQIPFSRRSILKGAGAFAMGALLQPLCTVAVQADPFAPAVLEKRQSLFSSYRGTLKGLINRSRLPIIDVEHHWGNRMPIKDLIDKMDSNDVALTWLGANEGNGSQSSIDTCRLFPDRLVPTTIHGDGRRWHGHDLSVVQELDADVRSGQYFAMGEFEARHYVSSTNNRDIHMPVDSESFHGVFRAAEATGVPFLLHHEAEDALLPELERMLSAYPQANVVWCHVGRNRNPQTWTQFPTADGVRRFIQKYPNLHFDVLQSGPMSIFPPTQALESVLYDGSRSATLKSEWLQLFKAFPNRFLIGSDINTGRWSNYNQVMSRLQTSVLRVVSPKAAEQIAFKNAWRLMGGGAWSS